MTDEERVEDEIEQNLHLLRSGQERRGWVAVKEVMVACLGRPAMDPGCDCRCYRTLSHDGPHQCACGHKWGLEAMESADETIMEAGRGYIDERGE